MINEYRTREPEFGYNICVGGGGTSGCVIGDAEKKRRSDYWKGENNPNYNGKMWTPEYREHMRQVNLGKKLTEEHKRKIGDALRGRKHVSEAGKKHIAETHSRSIRRDDGVIFDSVNEAAASVGVTPSAISKAMRKGQRSGKHYWELLNSKA